MEDLLGLIAPLLAQLAVANDGHNRTPRAIVDLACLILAVLGAIAAAGCLVAALWLSAVPRLGPAAASATCAVALIVVCAILMAVGTGWLRRPTAAPAPLLIDLLRGIDGERLMRDHKSDLLIAAVVMGLLAGGLPAAGHPATERGRPLRR